MPLERGETLQALRERIPEGDGTNKKGGTVVVIGGFLLQEMTMDFVLRALSLKSLSPTHTEIVSISCCRERMSAEEKIGL